MKISEHKSAFYINNVSDQTVCFIDSIFLYKMLPMDQGFHYLGFFLKPNYHRIEDWRWLLKITEGKVHNWCYPWLSIGGRLTLIKSTLKVSVFWLSLAKISKSIYHKIHQCMSNFLWIGNRNCVAHHLVNWEILAQSNTKVVGVLKTYIALVLL